MDKFLILNSDEFDALEAHMVQSLGLPANLTLTYCEKLKHPTSDQYLFTVMESHVNLLSEEERNDLLTYAQAKALGFFKESLPV